MDNASPQRKKATQEHTEEQSGARYVDSGFHVQLEKDEGGSTRQSWLESSSVEPSGPWE